MRNGGGANSVLPAREGQTKTFSHSHRISVVESWKKCSCETAISGVQLLQVASLVALAVTLIEGGANPTSIWFC